MAAVLALMGGMVGFGSGVVSVVFFGASMWMALAIWSGVGMGCLALGLAILIRREDAPQQAGLKAETRAA